MALSLGMVLDFCPLTVGLRIQMMYHESSR